MREHQNHHLLTAGIAEEDKDEEDDLYWMVVMHRWVCGREHWDEEGCRVDDLMRRSRC
jgi:hypothetical protein